MLKHRTTDPALRAYHIADRLEREYEREHGYEDWPTYWLRTREEVLKEMMYEGLKDPQAEQAQSEARFNKEQDELFKQIAMERFTEVDLENEASNDRVLPDQD